MKIYYLLIIFFREFYDDFGFVPIYTCRLIIVFTWVSGEYRFTRFNLAIRLSFPIVY